MSRARRQRERRAESRKPRLCRPKSGRRLPEPQRRRAGREAGVKPPLRPRLAHCAVAQCQTSGPKLTQCPQYASLLRPTKPASPAQRHRVRGAAVSRPPSAHRKAVHVGRQLGLVLRRVSAAAAQKTKSKCRRAPDARSARGIGMRGGAERRRLARIQGKRGIRAPLLQSGSPGTVDGEAISVPGRSFPGVADATRRHHLAAPAHTIESASRQRPLR